jgi:hypothetical protein
MGDPALNHLTQLRAVSATFAAAAAGNYADNDVISNDAGAGLGDPMEFRFAVGRTGGAAKLVSATLQCNEDSLLATSELFLFSQAPTTATEMDDNAAWGGVAAAELPYFLGSFTFAALADIGAGSFATPATLTPAAPMLIRAEATSIFGILVLRDAEINETAGMTVTVTLFVDPESD